MDAMDRNATRMSKCKNWRKLAEDRDVSRQRTEKTKVQVGL